MTYKKHAIVSLLLMTLLIKFTYFYQMTQVRNNFFVLLLVTSFIYGLIILMPKRLWLQLVLTSILTFLLQGELLYFRYFNKLLSLSNVSQAKFAGEVSGVMFGLIRLTDVLLFLDIFVLLFVLVKKKDLISYHVKAKFSLLLLVLCLPFMFLSSKGHLFAMSVTNQEFFMYHIKDAYQVVGKKADDQVVITPEAIEEITEEYIEEKAYKGLFDGKNLITIQVESLQDMMVLSSYEGQEITPFLNSLITKDSFYFSSYYQQLGRGNTSDSEFSSHNSMYPSMDGISYERYRDHNFKGLPVLLGERGYETLAFHGNKGDFWAREQAYPNQGIKNFYSAEDLIMDEIIDLGLSDVSMYKQSIEILKSISKPFYGFYITLTNHNPYHIPKDQVSIDVSEADKKLLFGSYIESVRYTDEAIQAFYHDLEKEGLLENTVLIIYGDHHGITAMDKDNHDRISEFLGHDYDFEEMMNIPLIIHAPGMGYVYEDDHVFDQQDLLPTLVNLFNIEEPPHMMGQDMLNTEDYYALFQTYMVKGSFIKDDIVFEMSRDGVFENSRAWNRITKEAVDISLCQTGYKRALYELALSKYLLDNNKIIKE